MERHRRDAVDLVQAALFGDAVGGLLAKASLGRCPDEEITVTLAR
ncbi:hypothetical protein ACGH7X_00220 [Streptomyces sp. BBFR51]